MAESKMPTRQPGESAANFGRRMTWWLTRDTARSKGDDREWTGSPPFHLDRRPDGDKKR